MNQFCILHPTRDSTHFLTVPCAEDGKIGICVECNARFQRNDKTFIPESFHAYRDSKLSARGQRIAQFKRLN